MLGLLGRIERRRRELDKWLPKGAASPSTKATGLLDFVPATTRGWLRPEHLAPIAGQLEATTRGAVRAILNAPPRHGKTELLLHFIAWYLRRHPDRTVGYASHSAALALSKSRAARDYARRVGVTVRDDADSQHEWRTPQGGGCLAAGVMGSWTGHGVNVLLVDDPYADRQDAESPLIRSRVRDWFQSVANTRIEPGGSIAVSHTRWHERDLAGWIQTEAEDRAQYTTVNLPAIDGAGNALWPARWSLAALEQKRLGVGPYEWASLYLGAPVPRGGEVFKGAPARYVAPHYDGARIVLAMDPAGSSATDANLSALVALAIWSSETGPVADVIDVVTGQWETALAAEKAAAFQRDHFGADLHIEASRDGKQIARAMRLANANLRIIECAPYASKFVRAQPCAGAYAAQRVRVPLAAPWLDDFLFELSRFTGVEGGHDDRVDALTLAWNVAVTPAQTREWSATETYIL